MQSLVVGIIYTRIETRPTTILGPGAILFLVARFIFLIFLAHRATTTAADPVDLANLKTDTMRKTYPNFYYSRGEVETVIPWARPSWDRAFKYFSYVKSNSDILDRHELHVVGGFLHYMQDTWDLDVNMTGDFKSYQQVERDQNYLLDASLNKFKLLTDVKWVSRLYPGTTYENADLVSTEVVSIEVRNLHMIKCGEAVNVIDENRSAEVIEKLTDNLYRVTRDYVYKDKKIEFLKKLETPGVQVMSVRDFLSLSEAQFFEKINNK